MIAAMVRMREPIVQRKLALTSRFVNNNCTVLHDMALLKAFIVLIFLVYMSANRTLYTSVMGVRRR